LQNKLYKTATLDLLFMLYAYNQHISTGHDALGLLDVRSVFVP